MPGSSSSPSGSLPLSAFSLYEDGRDAARRLLALNTPDHVQRERDRQKEYELGNQLLIQQMLDNSKVQSLPVGSYGAALADDPMLTYQKYLSANGSSIGPMGMSAAQMTEYYTARNISRQGGRNGRASQTSYDNSALYADIINDPGPFYSKLMANMADPPVAVKTFDPTPAIDPEVLEATPLTDDEVDAMLARPRKNGTWLTDPERKRIRRHAKMDYVAPDEWDQPATWTELPDDREPDDGHAGHDAVEPERRLLDPDCI